MTVALLPTKQASLRCALCRSSSFPYARLSLHSSNHIRAPVPLRSNAHATAQPGLLGLRRRCSHAVCSLLPRTSSATGSVLRKGTGSEVRWGTYISEAMELEKAVDEAVSGILESVGTDTQPDVAVVFVSSKHSKHFSSFIPYLRQKLPSIKYIFGCSGYGVLGGAASGPKEVVDDYALSLSLGCLPGVKISLTHTLRSAIPSEDAAPDAWTKFVGLPDARDKSTSFFILCDHSFQHWDKIIEGLDYAFHHSKTLGGQLSLAHKNRTRGLFCWSADAEAAALEARRAAEAAAREKVEAAEAERAKGGWLSRLASFMNLDDEGDADGLEDMSPRGLYQYGAVIMGMQGDVQLDILSHEGFRFMSDKTYVVEEAYGNMVLSVREQGAPSSKRISPGEMLIEVLEPTIRKRAAEMEGSEDGILSFMHEVFPDMAVAVAPSSEALNKDGLELEDFALLGISGLNGEDGHMEVYSINNTVIAPGQRLRLVTVDNDAVTDDLRQRMLSYKRRELQDMMMGRSLPPAFGALLLSNQAYSQEQGSESTTTVFNYVPVPTSGVLLSNQFATDKNNTTKTTHAGVLAIMRAGAKPLELAELVDDD